MIITAYYSTKTQKNEHYFKNTKIVPILPLAVVLQVCSNDDEYTSFYIPRDS